MLEILIKIEGLKLRKNHLMIFLQLFIETVVQLEF
jgi:hypothetical protein